MATIISLNVSETVGNKKQPTEQVVLKENHGIEGDAHARDWHRQVSLLAQESIDKMSEQLPNLAPGSFAENITTKGIILKDLPIGTRLSSAHTELEITQIGKKCHAKCNIFKEAGGCIMPEEGVFAKVIRGGTLNTGEELLVNESVT
jgi:MOSC domain-containing protein YiiM